MTKLWGGRFEHEADAILSRFNDSIGFDRRLWEADLRGSRAYAEALHAAAVLTTAETQQILQGLEAVGEEWAAGRFLLQPDDEDIHTAVERRLHELIGPVAGKLHTGRSRNDQVATDLRLFLRQEIGDLDARLVAIQRTLVAASERYLDLILPGYTHLQPAQPIRFSHWLLSYFWMLQRDRERLHDLSRRVEVLPLGSGALAGTPLAIDRQALAARLGFSQVSPNSLDAVSDRDFVAEFLFWAALLGVHLSRLSEDLILFSNPSLGFVILADAFTTGSSLMPQKKNPDAFELARGKAGRLIGHLTGLLTTLKGLPSSYNKDLQEDKEPLFDAIDTLALALPVLTGAMATLSPQPERMAAALRDDMLATDLADWLVAQGVPFRQSHGIVGEVVRLAERRGCLLRQLDLADLQAIHPAFSAQALAVWDFERSVEQRSAPGGTARTAVLAQITAARALCGA
ncbi:MAG: argininosuccinate lyase [Caldilineales bacterium]|nr:argininosuccinate lyase [Caldilineales bacterium]MCW5860541.1 argininosuccinate lyase [Caldilineales bacterium]